MTSIIGFLMANWPYILAYPFVGYTLAKISNKLFSDDTPTNKLNLSRKITRTIFFPFRVHSDDWRNNRKAGYYDYPCLDFRNGEREGDKIYGKTLTLLWPLSSIAYVFGLFEAIVLTAIQGIIAATEFTINLPEKSYSLLQSGSRQIKLLAPGNNRDIKTSISQIEEFKDAHLKSEKNKIVVNQITLEDRLRVINGSLESWQVIVRKNADTAAKINPIIESLGKEKEMLTSKKSNLCQLEEKLNAGEKNLSESLEILWRCLSTIPLGVPVYTDGPQLIKGDYVATLAAETISQAETEISRIKQEIAK
ncbi:MAG: hypothetical protein HYX20_00680 [Candidatus Yanofskybacteria bacterium]|nr:hypothetical protein [Candidatus Yanofskybacteria bacterium]